MNFIFPYIGNFIIPTDELIFFIGVGSTTNQIVISTINHNYINEICDKCPFYKAGYVGL